MKVGDLGSWSYQGRLAVEPSGEDDTWLVDWSPSALHPDLTPTTRLEAARSKPERAPVLDRDGVPLAGTGTTLGRVVGHVDEITEEQLAELEGPYLPGDQVGQRGLQLAFEEQLAGGREFGNFQDMALGEIPFREAIYESCNTAFVQLAAQLDGGAIDTTAEDFGFDVDHSLPVDETIAQYPQPGDLAERAAAVIGQGRVLATPVHMASVAAAVSNGPWQAPSLVRDAGTDAPSRDIEDVAGPLTEAMREVPRQGTAEDADLPDGVAGKTGTAEVGTAEEGEELATNAWFIGFADVAGEQLAFAVVVEGGESGGSAAAPVTARLLHAMDGP